MRMKKWKTVYGNHLQKTDVDCCVCKRRKECDVRAESKFCDSFRSETFNSGKRKPLDVWEQERKDRQAVKKQ